MPNPYYTATGIPIAQTRGVSPAMRNEFLLIQNAFSMVASATGYNSGIDTGAANAYVVNPLPALSSIPQFTQLLMLVGAGNTNLAGACTINVSGLGTKSIVRRDGSNPQPGDLKAASVVLLYFDGTNWQLQGNALAGNATSTINMNGNALQFAQANPIASAATLNLDAAAGNSGQITGTTAITSVTLAAGHMFFATFAASLTLTNSASLILPGNANITTQAGDMAFFLGTGSGNVAVFYMSVSGYAINQTWAEVATASFSSVASVNYLNLFTSQYDSYRIELENFIGDASGFIEMQLAIGGSASSAANYIFTGNSSTGGVNTGFSTSGQTSYYITHVAPSSSSSYTSGGSIDIFNTANTSAVARHVTVNMGYANASNAAMFDASGGFFLSPSSGAITGFKIMLSSGGNMSGKIKIYGKQA